MVKRTPALNTEKVKSTKNTKVKRRERNAKKEKTAAQTRSLTKRFKKVERKRRARKRKEAKMQTNQRGLAHGPKALQHLVLNLSLNRNLLKKIQSPLQQIRLQSLSSETHLVLVNLRSCLTLFPRWRIWSTKAQRWKGQRKRKEVPVGHLKVKRDLEEDEPDQDHPDESQSAGQDPQNENRRPLALEIAQKRGLLNRERKADRGQRDTTIGPDLILSEEANIQDPGHAPDQGLLLSQGRTEGPHQNLGLAHHSIDTIQGVSLSPEQNLQNQGPFRTQGLI